MILFDPLAPGLLQEAYDAERAAVRARALQTAHHTGNGAQADGDRGQCQGKHMQRCIWW